MPTMTPQEEFTATLEECVASATRLAGKVNHMSSETADEFDREWQRLAEAVPRARELLPRIREHAADEGLVLQVTKAEDLLDRLEAQLAGLHREVLKRQDSEGEDNV